MTGSQSLETALLASGAIAALVGTRIYPLIALEPAGQAVLIYTWSENWQYTLSGVTRVDVALEIKAWAKTYQDADLLAAAVRGVLMPAGQPKGFHGLLGGTGGVNVIHCLIDANAPNLVAVEKDLYRFEVVSKYDLKYIL